VGGMEIVGDGVHAVIMDMQYFLIFSFSLFLQDLIEFKDFFYVQVSITLHYFIFGLGFIQVFLCNIPLVSGI
jgi:hypothetical protein